MIRVKYWYYFAKLLENIVGPVSDLGDKTGHLGAKIKKIYFCYKF